jgi:hypothetical protein
MALPQSDFNLTRCRVPLYEHMSRKFHLLKINYPASVGRKYLKILVEDE